MKIRLLSIFLLVLTSIGLTGCSVNYGFKSTSVPDAKSIAITMFYNESDGGNGQLHIDFTEDLREYFQRNTKLDILTETGEHELLLEGAIVDYDIQSIAPTSNGEVELASLNRFIITVNAKYTNPYNEKDNFDRNFSHNVDFDADEDISSVEEELLDQLFEQIILKIFTASFDNW